MDFMLLRDYHIQELFQLRFPLVQRGQSRGEDLKKDIFLFILLRRSEAGGETEEKLRKHFPFPSCGPAEGEKVQ